MGILDSALGLIEGFGSGVMINDIPVMAIVEEAYHDELQITEHPVETGAAITDHAYKKPAEIVLMCGWSNSNTKALFSSALALFTGGSISGVDYVGGVYAQLLALQEARTPFPVTTTRRQYDNMLIQSLDVTNDKTTSNALFVTARLRQIILVSTQETSLPDVSKQAYPSATAAPTDSGTVAAVPATPAPGGAVSPDDM